MNYDLIQLIIIEFLLVLYARRIFRKLREQRLQEDIMILRLKIWLLERGCDV
ncbi:hypothetical protein SAMN02910415_01818 [Basfia succiniciproducens]|nr:hypothetical protein SAMN02910415_01818 [Basfia succiniciproducens]